MSDFDAVDPQSDHFSEEPPLPPRRPPGRRTGVNELPVWTWVAILLFVVVVGLALWAMNRTGAEEVPAGIEPLGTSTPAGVATSTPAGPTLTPVAVIATPPASAPAPLNIGQQVEVFGTGADKLRVRSGPGTTFATLLIVADGTRFTVLEGPQDGEGLSWWRVQAEDGTIGWVAASFIRPVSQ